jgi:alpha-D-ribose 1-methylphosphonate 5-triphosphate diphosphatase
MSGSESTVNQTHTESAVEESPALVVENGRVVTPKTVIDGSVHIEDGRITAVEENVSAGADADRRIDADEQYVLPGLIDLHGDDIEHHLFPRSGSRVDPKMALAAADRENLAAGVTTKFHAVSFENNPEKDRSPELANDLVDAIGTTDDHLANHRIHARCEITELGCVNAVGEVLGRDHVDLVSVMAHIPGKGQFQSEATFREYYEENDHLSLADAEQLIEHRTDIDDETLATRIDRIVAEARDASVPVASHDDESPVEVERLHERGVAISEYPITRDAATRARDLGMTTAMGAPNLVRGGSQWGNLRTADAIEAGAADALVADYHPSSLLASPFIDTGEPLSDRVARVTYNPAEAVGLTNRGRITENARADVIVVDPDPTPTVQRAIIGGQDVYHAGGRR